MPIYERRCTKCKHVSEQVEPMNPEDPSKYEKCPKCKAKGTFQKVMAAHAKMGRQWADAAGTPRSKE